LREVAANRSVDQLAPSNPVAAEMAQMRATLEEIRSKIIPRPIPVPRSLRADLAALRNVVERNIPVLDAKDFEMLSATGTSASHDDWVQTLEVEWKKQQSPSDQEDDPWLSDSTGGPKFTDEPPF
jgi:hypothetical protein